LFDAIEFREDIACIDVLYDLAFLLMDLWKRRLPGHANAVLNGYLGATGDVSGLGVMPIFLSCRAAVRAKTSAAAATLLPDGQGRAERESLARDYLRMAAALIRPPFPCVVAVGGHSGSGKSMLAKAVAPFIGAVPGAVLIRSDEVRKRLHGVSPLTRLGADAYTPEASERVYAALRDRTRTVVNGRHAALVDAVFTSREERDAVEQLAVALGVPFVGLWLEAPEKVLVERASQRHNDPSDADAEVIRMQLRRDLGPVSWQRIDASTSATDVQAAAATHLAAVGCYRTLGPDV
jgi:predicted kinase